MVILCLTNESVRIGSSGFTNRMCVYKRVRIWIREAGFEWLYRLLQEPGHLWVRYGRTIPPFIYLATKQLVLSTKTQKL